MAYAHDPSDAHAQHHHANPAKTTRSSVDYVVPNVTLVRDDGNVVALQRELADGRPVVLNFIYTSCTTICPVSSQVFAALQDKLGTARDKVHLVSISIDPEEDTPSRLRQYANRFGADSEWHHYTGTREASLDVQRAFGVERGGKMNHTPVTLIRMSPEARWVRIDGFATADELAGELRAVGASR